jgi:hypothetical protein
MRRQPSDAFARWPRLHGGCTDRLLKLPVPDLHMGPELASCMGVAKLRSGRVLVTRSGF